MAPLNFPENSIAKYVGQFVFPLFVTLCICLDVLSLIVLPLLPGPIDAIACELWPIVGSLGSFMSHSLASFVADQCTFAQPIEPAISIVFLQTKIFLALVLGIAIGCLAIAFPGELSYRTYAVDVRRPGGNARWARNFALFFGVMGGSAIFTIVDVGVFGTPDTFSTEVFHKVMQDVATAALYLTIAFSLLSIGLRVRFALGR